MPLAAPLTPNPSRLSTGARGIDRQPVRASTMVRWTIFCLILLRLAIGWHFLVEGWLQGPVHLRRRDHHQQAVLERGLLPLGTRPARTRPSATTRATPTTWRSPGSSSRPPRPTKPPATDEAASAHPDGPREGLGRLPRALRENTTDLSDDQAKQAKDKLRQAKAAVVGWLTYLPPDDPASSVTRTRATPR